MPAGSALALPDVFTWTFPGAPIQIRIRLAVIDELKLFLTREPGSDASLVIEGGLLLGAALRPGVTEITGFQPIASLESKALEETLAKRVDKFVGFYRAARIGSLVLNEDDLSLASRYFHDPSSVILLIEADRLSVRNACFFFWDQGRIHGDLPLMEIPFDARMLALAEGQRVSRTSPNRKQVISPNHSEQVARPTGSSLRIPTAAIVILLAAMIFGGYLFATRSHVPAEVSSSHQISVLAPHAPETVPVPVVINPTAKPSLDFTADRRGAEIVLTWNRESPVLANPTFGMLLIRDLNGTREIALTPDQLRMGKILYTSTADRVDVQLNVVAGEHVTRDSLIILQPGRRNASRMAPASPGVDQQLETSRLATKP